MTSLAEASPAVRRWTAVAVICGVFPLGVAYTLSSSAVALMLEARGVGAGLIGLNAAMLPLAGLVIGPFAPRIAAHLGPLRAIVWSTLAVAAASLAFAVTDDLAAWFVFRAVIGAGVALQWIVNETWINAAAPPEERGRLLGLYSTVLALGFAAGPALVTALGADGPAPFLAAAAINLAILLPYALVWRRQPVIAADTPGAVLAVAGLVPVAFVLAALGGLGESMVYGLFPVFGVAAGATEAHALNLSVAFFLGNVAMQVPIGAAIDRFGPFPVLAVVWSVAVGGAFALPATAAGTAGLAVAFLWGGGVFSFYIVGLVLLARRLTPETLATGNAGYIVAYNAGGLLGAPAAGAAMDAAGVWGFTGVMIAACLTGLLLHLLRRPLALTRL